MWNCSITLHAMKAGGVIYFSTNYRISAGRTKIAALPFAI